MITSVYIDTDELVFQLHSVSDDAQKALEWVRSFRDTLMFGARIQNPLPFAMECMAMSEGFSASGVLGKLRAAARKRLNDEGVDPTAMAVDAEIARTQGADAVREIMAKIERANSLKAEIRRRKFTAATTTREGVDESTTGCNNSQVAPTRKAGDESPDASNGAALKSATACNHYDQETKISTNSPAGAGVNFDSTQTNKRPDASSGNAEGQTITTAETLDKAGAGEVPPENVSAKPSPALPVLSFGEFGNIKMTNMQYANLCDRFSIANSVLAEADQYFEAQPAKKKKYKNHYAMLLNWCKRREMDSKPKQGFKTSAEKQRDELQKIADYYASKEVVG